MRAGVLAPLGYAGSKIYGESGFINEMLQMGLPLEWGGAGTTTTNLSNVGNMDAWDSSLFDEAGELLGDAGEVLGTVAEDFLPLLLL